MSPAHARRRSMRAMASKGTDDFGRRALGDATNRAPGHALGANVISKGCSKATIGAKRARAKANDECERAGGKSNEAHGNALEDGEQNQGARARASARKGSNATGSGREKSVGDGLECLERMPSERASRPVPNNARGMVATNSVEFPFSVHGGRRSQEVVEKNVLKPYVVNGKFFNIAMRQQLVDWMDEQHSELSLTEETLHLAIRYVDTFLSQRVPDVFLQRHGSGSEPVPCAPLKELNGKRVLYSMDVLNPLCNKLKRLGITCVFVAAKVTEVTTPSAVEFARYADVSSFTREQLLLAERALLRELNYSLIRPTAFSFAEAYVESANSALLRYADRFDFDPRRFNADFSTREDLFREMTYYFVELATVAHDSLGFSPSLLGAAAVASALRRFKINFDEVPMLREVAGYCDKELEGAVEFLKNLTRDAWMIQEYGEGLTVNRKYESVAEFLSDECSKC